jgi:hypothetical protein
MHNEELCNLNSIAMENSIEKFQKTVNFIESIFKILIYISIILAIGILSPKLFNFFQNAQITEADVAGFKLTLNQTKKAVEKTIQEIDKNVETKSAPNDSLPTMKIKDLAQNLNALNINISKIEKTNKQVCGWIFVGSYDKTNSKWDSQYFKFDTLKTNQKYITYTELNIRDAAPQKNGDGWQKGNINGVLNDHQNFSIQEIKEIPGLNNKILYWANMCQEL